MTPIPRAPTRRVVVLTAVKMGPFRQKISSKPMIKRLNRLLPNASPAARSGVPMNVTELTPVPSSGSDVAVASSPTPMSDWPRPVLN